MVKQMLKAGAQNSALLTIFGWLAFLGSFFVTGLGLEIAFKSVARVLP